MPTLLAVINSDTPTAGVQETWSWALRRFVDQSALVASSNIYEIIQLAWKHSVETKGNDLFKGVQPKYGSLIDTFFRPDPFEKGPKKMVTRDENNHHFAKDEPAAVGSATTSMVYFKTWRQSSTFGAAR